MHQIRFTPAKLRARLELLKRHMFRRTLALAPFEYHTGMVQRDETRADGWRTLQPGSMWGEQRQEFSLYAEFCVPADWNGNAALLLPLGTTTSQDALKFLYGPEALLSIDDNAYQGVDRNHALVTLDAAFHDARAHRLLLHGWTGIKDERYFIGAPALVQVDDAVRGLVAQLRVGLGAIEHLPETSPERARLLDLLDAVVGQLDLSEPFGEPFYTSAARALAHLTEHLNEAGPALGVSVAAVGHAHIDVAWLWTLAQTRHKAARTFSTVLRLMEHAPEFRFSQSQPQLYQYIEQDHPELFAKIQDRIAAGQWETLGGMWVEADCNLSGGEALVRQFLLGREYFHKFAAPDAPVLWLPDVFGYAWQLPQLIRGAGLEYFVTAKLSWNQYNRLPYDSFWWQGLDGTRVLTQFITTTAPGWWGATYSAELTPAEILGTWSATQHKELSQALLIPYGHGDGGGGPTPEMIENRELMAAYPGLPKVQASTVRAFMERLDAVSGSRLPVWNGELYFELHRGTYTTQAKNKRANRKSEFLLHDAEFLATWAHLATGMPYPHAELKRAWELLCLNQFHDIIPGSSIAEVYDDSARDYEVLANIGTQVREDAIAALCEIQPASARLVVLNPTGFERHEVVLLPPTWQAGTFPTDLSNGETLPVQTTENGTLCAIRTVPAYGMRAFGATGESTAPLVTNLFAGKLADAPADARSAASTAWVLENNYVRAEFDEAGDLVRLYDKRVRREILAKGSVGNQWQSFQDRPLDWEAWDIEIFYDDQCVLADAANLIRVAERGPLRAALEIERRIFGSTIHQKIYLHHDRTRLDFETTIDWQTRHTLLKVAFPLELTSPRATYEIQWGNVERPTHRNTSWDWARFESCAHKWADLSEGDYGVSLLNDCKYGHDIRDNVMRLTVLRGPTFPDPNADVGVHHFTYSLLPHRGGWQTLTAREAYALNDPLIVRVVTGPGAPAASETAAFVTLDSSNVIIETVKLAEHDDGVIVRLYEYCRTRAPLTLTTGFAVESAELTNLLEESAGALASTENSVALYLTPYQILSTRIRPKSMRPDADE